jgi:hypothetical protein
MSSIRHSTDRECTSAATHGASWQGQRLAVEYEARCDMLIIGYDLWARRQLSSVRRSRCCGGGRSSPSPGPSNLRCPEALLHVGAAVIAPGPVQFVETLWVVFTYIGMARTSVVNAVTRHRSGVLSHSVAATEVLWGIRLASENARLFEARADWPPW